MKENVWFCPRNLYFFVWWNKKLLKITKFKIIIHFDYQIALIIVFELFYALLTKFKLLIKKVEGSFFLQKFHTNSGKKAGQNWSSRAELKPGNTELSETLTGS